MEQEQRNNYPMAANSEADVPRDLARQVAKRRCAQPTRYGLHGSALPAGCRRLSGRVNAFRRALEAAVKDRHGEIDLHAAATIHTACRFETVAQLAARWLRLYDGQLSHADRLSYAREIAKSSAERDKCLRLLGLDRSATSTLIDALYSTPVIPPASVPERSPTGTPEASIATSPPQD